MLRRAGRKAPLERVTWDEALTFLAGKLEAIKKEHGPEAVAFFPHGISARFFSTVMKAYGTPNSAEPSFAQCRGPRDVGYQLTFGSGLGSPEPLDLEESKLIVLVGSHLGENVFTSPITQFADGLAKGAKLVVVDPRFSTAASKADWWLPIRPGTDIALLLAWANVLIAEELYDADYLAKHANGFDKLAAHVKDTTPEWAAPITDLPADLIRETARAMGAAKPAVVLHPGRHVTWYGDDTQRARAMAIVTACPYRARYVNPATRKVDKCDFCATRVERGQPPACVKTCTAHAKYFGDLEDPSTDVYRMVYAEGARRMETKDVAIGPRVYCLGRPEHLDLVLASFPPHPPRLLTAGETLRRIVKPLVLAAVGATFLGQAVAFFSQLWKGEEDHEH